MAKSNQIKLLYFSFCLKVLSFFNIFSLLVKLTEKSVSILDTNVVVNFQEIWVTYLRKKNMLWSISRRKKRWIFCWNIIKFILVDIKSIIFIILRIKYIGTKFIKILILIFVWIEFAISMLIPISVSFINGQTDYCPVNKKG